MTESPRSPSVVETALPGAVADLHLLERVDYADAFAIPARTTRSPEWWLRTFMEDAPLWFQVPWVTAGALLLGARFGPLSGDRDHVRGWKVLADRSDAFAIGLDSRAGLSARLTAHTPHGEAVIATQIRLSSSYARALWPAIVTGHRFFVPYLLRRAAELGRRQHEQARR